jgi:hypothetical protein
MSTLNHNYWTGVPEEYRNAWNSAFSDKRNHIRVTVDCPICSCKALLRWHDGSRGLWEWCSNCKVYEHSSALPPPDWKPEVVVKPVGLTAEPTAIVQALNAAGFGTESNSPLNADHSSSGRLA